jgi:ribonuclease HI
MRQLRAHTIPILKERLSVNKVIISTDGAARGNPGPAAIGATLKDEKGNPITRISRRIGITTNNQAEYQAIIAALEKAIRLGARYVELYTDSELVVKQINGRYRVKNTTLRPLYQKVVQLTGALEGFKITHIPRQQNAEADNLANKALDTK